MTADMPASCRILVYREVTSAVTNIALIGSGERHSVRLRKCFVILICHGRLLVRDCMK